MKAGNALLLRFYGLCLTLTCFGHGKRVQHPEPQPVDCLYSSWSAWTLCDPCTNERQRSRGIEEFGQFRGQPCRESLSESAECITEVTCAPTATTGCPAAHFQCGSGACIKQRLVCNHDFDCEDQIDEDACDRMSRKPCSTRTEETPGDGWRAAMGQGINILGSTPPKTVFYNGYFGGVCQIASGIRLPWNVAGFNLETHSVKKVTSDIYESSHQLVLELLSGTAYHGGLSIRSNPLLETSSRNETLALESKKFVRFDGKLQWATYRLRPRDLRVADGFTKDVKSLPVEYDKGSYFNFIEDYGTHYTRSGKLGGEYNLIYVLNVNEIMQRNLTDAALLECLKDFGFNLGVGATGNAKTSSCNFFNKVEGNAVVVKVLISVKGGDPEIVSAMKARISRDGQMSAETYQNWARSIANHPSLLYSEREPIYNVFPLGLPEANTKISNMKAALADYVAEYSMCKCRPCHNNGTLVLIDGLCSCFCILGYEGLACQNHEADKKPRKEPRPSVPRPSVRPPSVQRPSVPCPSVRPPNVPSPTVLHEANWACWSGWSTCSGGERSRSRACNVEGLPPGGVCSGPDAETDWC
ncbi:complement component C9 isoform X1 [Gadus morhua]|uniref:Complement component C9 n=1 Tax=Gadus morhua TaxID=8049 RepID=A0A8C5A6A5_GADMO|nr:complement component C9-like isoform X1 [Gadus morhua]